MEDKELRLRDATTLLASLARDFSGHYLMRLDSLNPQAGKSCDNAFEKLKEAARQFVEAEGAVDGARGDGEARAVERAAVRERGGRGTFDDEGGREGR